MTDDLPGAGQKSSPASVAAEALLDSPPAVDLGSLGRGEVARGVPRVLVCVNRANQFLGFPLFGRQLRSGHVPVVLRSRVFIAMKPAGRAGRIAPNAPTAPAGEPSAR